MVGTRNLFIDVTSANRVKEVFAQFVPSEGKHGKRYSSIATVVR